MVSIIFEIDDDDIIFSSYAHGGNHRILLQRRNMKLRDMFDGQNRIFSHKNMQSARPGERCLAGVSSAVADWQSINKLKTMLSKAQ